MNVWEFLGLEPTSDKRQIKKAYVKLLKQNNPEDNPKGFQELREAYDYALRCANHIGSADSEQHSPTENTDSEAKEFSESFSILDTYPQEAYSSPQQEPEYLRIRNEQIERVKQAVQAVALSLKISEDEAIERCQLQLSDEYFQALDVQYRYEGELLREVYQRDKFPFRFVSFLADAFQWNTEVQSYNNPSSIFDNDADYYQAFVNVYRYFIFEKTKLDILENYRRNLPPSETASEVEDILFSEYDEGRLATFKRSAPHRGILYKLVAYIKARNYDKLDLSPIPYETLQWLEHNDILRNPASTPSDSNKDSSNRGFNWGAFLIIFILIKLVFFLTKDNSPNYTHYEQNRFNERLEDFKDQQNYNEFVKQVPTIKVTPKDFEYLPDTLNDEPSQPPLEPLSKEAEGYLILPEKYKQLSTHGTLNLLDGSRYEGEILDNQPHGHGTLHYKSGGIFIGEFEYGTRLEGVYTGNNGDRFSGKFINNQYSEGKYTWATGESFEGGFNNGKYHIGTYRWPNGKTLEAEFTDGEPATPMIWRYADGSVFQVERTQDEMQFGIYTSAEGDSHHGGFLNDVKHGQGTSIYANGDRFTGQFEKGIRIKGEYLWRNGDKFSGQFKDNQPAHGEYYSAQEDSSYQGELLKGERTGSGIFEIDGFIYKGNFVKARLQGKGEMLDDRGYTYNGEFIDGLREGTFIVISPNGTKYRTKFKHDEQKQKLRLISK